MGSDNRIIIEVKKSRCPGQASAGVNMYERILDTASSVTSTYKPI